MKRLSFLLALSGAAALSGCAPSSPTEGEYLELSSINVQYRDLSTFTPTIVTRTDTTIRTQKPQALSRFTVKAGERYQSAIKRWLSQSGFNNVAWSLSPASVKALDGATPVLITYHGSLKKALSQLSDTLALPLELIHDQRAGVMGIYDFDGHARITHVSGSSLKQVVQHLVQNYGLRWDSTDGFSRSWLAADDYAFGADYYLLTRRDDIDTALTTVLEDYPVHASIVSSTGQVIIQENIQ